MGYWHSLYGYRSTDFVEGLIAGVEAYAFRKNGKQRVGISEIPFEEVVEEVKIDLLEDYRKDKNGKRRGYENHQIRS